MNVCLQNGNQWQAAALPAIMLVTVGAVLNAVEEQVWVSTLYFTSA